MKIYRIENNIEYFLAEQEVEKTTQGFNVFQGICHTSDRMYDETGTLHLSKRVKYVIKHE